MGKGRSTTKRATTRRPLYEHVPTKTVWRVVKEKPLTLSRALNAARPGRSYVPETRRPTAQTFAREYRLMEGVS